MTNLDKYIHDVIKSIQFKLPEAEIKDISEAIEELICHLIEKVKQIDPWFNVTRIFKVGSFYEGTKINEPNEFDFLVELQKLSDPNNASVETSCSGGAVHIRVDREAISHLKVTAVKLTGSDRLLLRPQDMQSFFAHHIREAVSKIAENPNIHSTKRSGKMQFILELRNAHPNTAVYLQWFRAAAEEDILLIGADITLCLHCPDAILVDDFHGVNREVLSQMPDDIRPVIVPPSVANMKSCSVGKGLARNCCWRLSFTPVEVELMNSLPENHKFCYKILKYICSKEFSVDTFSSLGLKSLSSYMLKTCVFYHNSKCVNSGDISICLRDIFDFLISCSASEFLPNYLMPKKNIWAVNFYEEVIVPDKILSMLFLLLFEKLDKCTVDYEYSVANKLMKGIRKKFDGIELDKFRSKYGPLTGKSADPQELLAITDKEYNRLFTQ